MSIAAKMLVNNALTGELQERCLVQLVIWEGLMKKKNILHVPC